MILATLITLAAETATGSPADYYPWMWVGGIVVGIGVITTVVNQVDEFLDRRKGKPGTPPNAQLEQSMKQLAEVVKDHITLSREEHAHHRKAIADVERRAEERLEKVIVTGNQSREMLSNRINECTVATSQLRGTMEVLTTYFK